MGTFRDLVAWQRAMDLVDAVYDATANFPRFEMYGLARQLRSAAVSIPTNIAEGKGRYTIGEERQFIRQARGSNYEVQTQIEIARRRKYIEPEESARLLDLAGQVGRLINGLLNSRRLKTP